MKICFYELENWEREYLKNKLKKHDVIFSEDKINNKNIKLARDCEIVSVFIYSKVDKKVLDKLENLKAIVTRSTGFNHIDVRECRRRNIKVLNVPYYGENTVAEHTFALMLALSRKIHKAYERTIRGNFSLEGLRGFDIKNKTLGIIGMGHIGQHVARIAKGFEMKVLAFDVKKNKKLEKKIGFKYVSMNNLLKNSDIVSLHCPYNKHTHHLINNKNFKLFKKGAYIINTARGSLIETKALVEALSKGDLGGAGLDVLEEESLIKEEVQLLSKNFPKENLENLLQNHLLLTFDNVIISPHNAFNSQEALQRILDTTVENIKIVSENKACKKEFYSGGVRCGLK